MSISGLFLILFLVFHLCMNIAAVFSGEAYNVICGLLGSNWYALLGTLVLAAGVVVHFVYAIILTLQNRKARGNDRYAINARPKGVEWASPVHGSALYSVLVQHDVCRTGRYSW